ncbi:deazaflavin-dependent oxidoreductase (nitroreductase family) [Lipingzhangella halophila]|uniref:Deazaflavin-dependent oxidoreductase (Nitroreductase family) n=1 Tax=Lipingzhangella halophila TaxID=1783352 RepID=A0A7W7RJG1_9ACTN|nr:nitroreductase/quinone reductase family protein [Lipingzhangella halophila]MBB4933007.1 deazaflavin-dependent oxidoreductase (nitroreductase family) [Lipingzhangella halophila]
MPNDFNQKIIEEFRANRGRVGGPFEGARLILLTTTGARSGAPHTAPVGYLPDEGDRILVIASAGGAPTHPDWYHNLVADPRATVEDGVFSYEARATILTGAERDRLFARAAEADPGWAEYQAATSRVIPVVALEEAEAGPPGGSSFGEGLRMIHDAFRRELELVRAEVARSGPGLGAQLRVNCLSFCGGLRYHHTMEDTAVFPTLGERHPELGPTLERLDREHQSIAAILEALQEVISTEGADPRGVLTEVDRLAAELEGHLDYEEEQLIPALDGLPA